MVKNGSIGASVLDNLASGNSITGIALDFGSASTMVVGNVISHNDFMGMWIHTSTGNSIYHNNFIANSVSYGAQGVDWSLANSWDGGTLREGNYWSDRVTPDDYGGTLQDQAGGDGIVDAPYVFAGTEPYARDNYPLASPWPSSGPPEHTLRRLRRARVPRLPAGGRRHDHGRAAGPTPRALIPCTRAPHHRAMRRSRRPRRSCTRAAPDLCARPAVGPADGRSSRRLS